MIKTVNTEAEYNALDKDNFESSAIFVRADNKSHIDGINVITINPEKGDILVLDENHVKRYIRQNTFVFARLSSTWTIVGTVACVTGNDVTIIHKTFSGLAYCNGLKYLLTGYTLDGTDRTGVLSIRDSSDWNTSKTYTISYNATTVDQLAEQLCTYFKANVPFKTQDWMATVIDGSVYLTGAYTDWRQVYNSANTGFSLTWKILDAIPSSNSMLRYNGARSDWGAISNMDRAIAFLTSDGNDTTWNPSSVLTSVKTLRPVCLPAYLGTSAYQSDHCAILRSKYGEGVNGWKEYLKSCLPVMPQKCQAYSEKYKGSLSNIKKMAAETRTKQDGSTVNVSPMAVYVQGIAYDSDGLRLGEWSVPGNVDLTNIMEDVHYGTNTDRQSDTLNKSQYLIGGSAISNGSNFWSCGRIVSSGGWVSNGTYGVFGNSGMYNGCVVVPVAHLQLNS